MDVIWTHAATYVEFIVDRIDTRGRNLSFLIPLLVHYDSLFFAEKQLVPTQLQHYRGPFHIDMRRRDIYITNMWKVLAKLYEAKSDKLHTGWSVIGLKENYINLLSDIDAMTDFFDRTTGALRVDDTAQREREGRLRDLRGLFETERALLPSHRSTHGGGSSRGMSLGSPLDSVLPPPPAMAPHTVLAQAIEKEEKAYRYERGLGVRVNTPQAKKLYKEAYDLYQQLPYEEDGEGAYRMSRLYAKGLGIEQDLEKALSLLNLACDQGHRDAHYELGILYLKGEGGGVERNKQEAISL